MRRLTLELSGRSRRGAWAASPMISTMGSRPKCLAGGGPLERRVRRRLGAEDAVGAGRIALMYESRASAGERQLWAVATQRGESDVAAEVRDPRSTVVRRRTLRRTASDGSAEAAATKSAAAK